MVGPHLLFEMIKNPTASMPRRYETDDRAPRGISIECDSSTGVGLGKARDIEKQ
jgi:hypothetical protein